MLIDQLFPQVIGAKATLTHRFVEEAVSRGVALDVANELLGLAPANLQGVECFLDNMTGLWRYEFGFPYQVGGDFVWGTHLWVPVGCLVSALCCVKHRLFGDKRTEYLARLADPDRHQVTLVEMIPGSKLSAEIPAEFEVAGLGAGNHRVDWRIGPHGGRTVLLDVKRRMSDFIQHAQQITNDTNVAPEPEHDPEILFLSVEDKFVSGDPDVTLQGAWIVTDIQQDHEELANAFAALDPDKVHFAILGDWETDAYVLSRRPEDEQYLRALLQLEPSSRFTFSGQHEG